MASFLSYRTSIYRRTLALLLLAVILILGLLGLVYFLLFSQARLNQLQDQLLLSAEAVADRLVAGMDAEHRRMVSSSEKAFVSFTAKANQAQVWVVNSEGEIILYSSLPRVSRQRLSQDNKQRRVMIPVEWQNNAAILDQKGKIVDQYQEVLPEKENWVSVSYPLPSPNGSYAGEVLLHYSLGSGMWRIHFADKAIWISIGIALAFAVLVITLLSRNITEPISRMVETAEAVNRGELSARVILPSEQAASYLAQADDRKADDLIILAKTMNTMIANWEQTEKNRQEFISSVSHDLRSPITSIRGFVTAMLDHTIPADRQDHYLRIIDQEARRMQNLVSDLLDLSSLEAKVHLHKQEFSILELFQQLEASLDLQLKDVDFSLRIDPRLNETDLIVLADYEAIYRVCNNIIANAFRYIPDQGKILVTIQLKTAASLELTIEDNGPGVPEKDMPHIFDRFYKVDKSRGNSGSGLGLYICKTILQMHGKNIVVGKSSLGGAKFVFGLDIARGQDPVRS